MTQEELKALHKKSSKHREAIKASTACGCFYCLLQFYPSEVREWIDGGQTALCPRCCIDAILPDNLPLDTLKEMQKEWFGKGVKADQDGKLTIECEIPLPNYETEQTEELINKMILGAIKEKK